MLSRLNSTYRDYTTQFDYVNKGLNFNFGRGNANTDIAIDALQGKYDFGFMSMDMSASTNYSRNQNPKIANFQFSAAQGIQSIPVPINAPPENLVSLTQFDSTKDISIRSATTAPITKRTTKRMPATSLSRSILLLRFQEISSLEGSTGIITARTMRVPRTYS